MAMWCGTLRGDDIQQATAELKSQRAAIRARFDREMKQLETKIADLETLEHFVVNFVADYNVEDESSAIVADPRPAAKKVEDESSAIVADPRPAAKKAAGEVASEQDSSTSSETPDARAKITSLHPKDLPSGVWTPAERALLAEKRA